MPGNTTTNNSGNPATPTRPNDLTQGPHPQHSVATKIHPEQAHEAPFVTLPSRPPVGPDREAPRSVHR
jgi:hypothetical protein